MGKDQLDLWKISDEGNTNFGQINDGVIESDIMGNQININSITSNNNILIGEIDNYDLGNEFQNNIPSQYSEVLQHFKNHNNDNIIFNKATDNDEATLLTTISDQIPEFTHIIENNILHNNYNSDQIEDNVVLPKGKKRHSFGSQKEASKKKRNMGQLSCS